jgi:hypothetical protein
MATYGQYIEFGPYFNNGLLCTLKVYHYSAGTTTLKDVYTVRAKTVGTEAAQPVVSDSNGIVGFYADGLYKFRLDVATDGVTYSTLYTPDNWAVTDQSGTLSGEGAALSSASTLTLGTDGNFFHVTGAVTITAISGTQNEITLVFDSTPTLTHSGNLILQYAADYVAAANVTMKFVNEGSSVWRELSRTPAFGAIDAAGDLIVGTANDTAARLAVGTAGQVLMMRTASTTKLAYNSVLTKLIHGMTWANNAGDATNDIDLAAGGCMDATGAYWITTAALTKQLDVNWAVGTNAGGLDTGAIGNSDYYIWAIARSDTGVTDYLYSLSSTAPTMPTNYDYKRLIGWFKRVGAAIVAFKTYEIEGGGIELSWTTPTLDVDILNTLTTSRRTDAVKVPLHFSVMANLRVVVDDASVLQGIVTCPDETDTAPSTTVAPLYNIRTQVAANTNVVEMRIRTSATGTVAARALSGTFDVYRIVTVGFTWARRN